MALVKVRAVFRLYQVLRRREAYSSINWGDSSKIYVGKEGVKMVDVGAPGPSAPGIWVPLG